MLDFETMKRSYAATIQCGLLSNVGCSEAKQGNEMLHGFCKELVELSNYSDYEKTSMKCELDAIKETLSQEIETFYAQQ